MASGSGPLSRDSNLRTLKVTSTQGVDARDNETLRAGANDSIGSESNMTEVFSGSESCAKMGGPIGGENNNK